MLCSCYSQFFLTKTQLQLIVPLLEQIFFYLSDTSTELFWVAPGCLSKDTLRLLEHFPLNLSPVSRFLLLLVSNRLAGMASRNMPTKLLGTLENFGAILAFENFVVCVLAYYPFAQIAAVRSWLPFFCRFRARQCQLSAFNFLNFESVFNFESMEPDIFYHITRTVSVDTTQGVASTCVDYSLRLAFA